MQNQEGSTSEASRMQKVYNAIYYKVNIFGYSVNLLVLLLVVALIVALVYNRNQQKASVAGDLTLSSTSSMGDIAAQMGGFSINTPNFIKGL